jgi:ribonuclease III
VRGLFDPLVAQIDPKASGKDAKTQLQEVLQSRRLPLPDYRLVDTQGEAHDQSFTVECVLARPVLSTRGVGKSRRAAEQEAARQACAALQSEHAAKKSEQRK